MANSYFFPTLISPADGQFCDKTADIPFSWSWNTDYTSYTVSWVSIYVYNSIGAQVYYKQITGNVTSYNLPADTLSAYGFCQWKITVRFNSETVESGYKTFRVQEEPPIATPISPKNTYIDGEESNSFAWSHSVSTGTDATRSDLQYSTNGSSWTDLATVSGGALSTVIPAKTLNAGRLYWRVRTYNANNIAGQWSSAAVCYVLAPVPSPTIIDVTINTARPTFSWSATTQNAFELDILQAGTALLKSGVVISSSKSYKFNEFLADGDYTARLRAYDGNGNYSEWATYTFAVSTVKPDVPTLTAAQSGNDIVLTIGNAVEENDCYILRDGKPIAKLDNPEPDYATHTQTDGSWSVADSAGGLVKDASISGNSTSGGTSEAPKTPLCLPAVTKFKFVRENIFDNTASAVFSDGSTLATINTGVRATVTVNGTFKYAVVPICKLSQLSGKTIKLTIGGIISSGLNTARVAVGFCDNNFSNRATKQSISTSGTITYTVPTNLLPTEEWLILLFYGTSTTSGNIGDYIDYTGVTVKIGADATTDYVSYTNPTTLTVPCDLWENDVLKPQTGEVIHGDAVIENYNGEPIPSTYRSSTGNLMPQKQVTNLVVNGDFSNGEITPFILSSVNLVSLSASEVTFLANAKYGRIRYSNFAPVTGHIYYYATQVKTDSPLVAIELYAKSSTSTSKAHSGGGAYEFLSITQTSGVDSTVQINVIDKRDSAWSNISAKYFVVIDLTAAFGAGNEPTAAEMDARLASSFPNSWFDGIGTLKGSYVVYKLATPTVEQFTPQPITLPKGVVNVVVESSNGVLPSEISIEYRLPPSSRTYTDDKTALEHAYVVRNVSPTDTYSDSAEASTAPTVAGYVLSNSAGVVNLKFRTSITDDFSNIGSSSHYTGAEFADFEFSEFSDNSFNLGFAIPRRHQSDLATLESIIKAKELTFVKSSHGDEMYCKITGYSKNPTKHQTEVTISLVRVNHSEVISYD